MGLFMRVNHPQANGYNLCVTHHENGCVTVVLQKDEQLVIESILPPKATQEQIESQKQIVLSFMKDTNNVRT